MAERDVGPPMRELREREAGQAAGNKDGPCLPKGAGHSYFAFPRAKKPRMEKDAWRTKELLMILAILKTPLFPSDLQRKNSYLQLHMG